MKLVILLLVIGGAAGEVVVYKCCPEDHQFREGKCLGGGPKEWAPVVYSPTTRGFLAPGTTPLDWKFVVSKPDTCSKPHFYETELGSPPPFVVFENGSLFHQDDHDNLVHPGGFCIDSAGALACLRADPEGPLEPASTSVSVRKCCGPGAAYSETNESCVAVEGERHRFGDFEVHSGFPVCPEAGSYAVGGKLNTTHWLHDDGTLRGGERRLNGEQFCLERIVEHPEEPLHVFTCPGSHVPAGDPRFTLYPVGLFLSVFFLVITLIASCLLPSTYHVLHWRCQTNHVACLLIGDLLLAITQLSGDAIKGPACISVAIAMHFIFLAAFFWLNTMCFNIWWTFRDLRPASLDKGQEACRLRLYELYAWGGPLLIAGLAALMDNLPHGSHPNFLRPRFGQRRCWFYGDAELLSYFFGPIGVLLFLNLTLFAATARELTCGLWKTEVVKSNTERATLGRVCLKLVVVMGITWVADLISWGVGGPNYLWYVTDFINAIQGVLIFAVVGCQPQVLAALKRFCCFRDSPSDGGNARSSSSHGLPSVGEQNTSIITNNSTKPVDTLC